MRLPEAEANYIRGPKGYDIAVEFGDTLTLSFWDLWCLMAVRDRFSCDFEKGRSYFENILSSKSFWIFSNRDQIRDLHYLLGVLSKSVEPFGGVSAILEKVPERLIKKELSKVILHVLEASSTHAPSDEMFNAPYRLLRKEALRGQWEKLPVNPCEYTSPFTAILSPKKKIGYIPKGATFKLAGRLEEKINKILATIDKKTKPLAHKYAVHRALLSLYQEQNCWDDSFGVMGSLGQDWVKAILLETPRSLDCEADVFLKDLLMLHCWEDYGLVSTKQLVFYINHSLDREEREMSVLILENIRQRALAAFCPFNSDSAQRVLTQLLNDNPKVANKICQTRAIPLKAEE